MLSSRIQLSDKSKTVAPVENLFMMTGTLKKLRPLQSILLDRHVHGKHELRLNLTGNFCPVINPTDFCPVINPTGEDTAVLKVNVIKTIVKSNIIHLEAIVIKS